MGRLVLALVCLSAFVIACGPDASNGDVTDTPTATATSETGSTGAESPTTESATATATPQPSTYSVQAGDSLGAVCAAQLPTMAQADCLAAVVSLNALAGPDQIFVGQVLMLPGSAGVPSTPGDQAPPPTPSGLEAAVVASVTDGDTVVLDDGRRLRYIGMDTPETVAPGEPVQCYGPESSARNAELVLGQTVYLERDSSEIDRYDRLLRYVYLGDGRMVNEILVAEGYAESIAYPPDTKHQTVLDAAESQAMAAGLGRWSACLQASAPQVDSKPVVVEPSAPVGSPSGNSCPQGCSNPPPGCLIKGNITTEHIYHVPGQRDYDKTIIDPSKGERWFCTEDEAVANGWRAAKR